MHFSEYESTICLTVCLIVRVNGVFGCIFNSVGQRIMVCLIVSVNVVFEPDLIDPGLHSNNGLADLEVIDVLLVV